MRVALIHEYLVQYGGAEKTLEALREIFPKAPVYTLLYSPKAMRGKFSDAEIRTSFLQKIPFAKSHHRLFFPLLMPMAIEQFDLSYYDLVISDSSSFAKGVITKPRTKHICYCHTPTRFAWDSCQKYIQDEFSYPRILKKLVPFGVNYVRVWDQTAANRVDDFIANSKFVASRIKKYYNRDSEVIYPPVDVKEIQEKIKNISINKEYFLCFGRVMFNKRLDILVEAFNNLGLPLKIGGSGPALKDLKKIAKPNIEFLGFVPENEVLSLYAGARAFVFPSEEDFGIAPLQASAMGKPVIALRAGGTMETIIENKTGVFFDEQTPKSLIKAMKRFLEIENRFNIDEIMSHARTFDKEVFKTRVIEHITHNMEQGYR